MYSIPHESDGRDRSHIREIGLPSPIRMKVPFSRENSHIPPPHRQRLSHLGPKSHHHLVPGHRRKSSSHKRSTKPSWRSITSMNLSAVSRVPPERCPCMTLHHVWRNWIYYRLCIRILLLFSQCWAGHITRSRTITLCVVINTATGVCLSLTLKRT